MKYHLQFRSAHQRSGSKLPIDVWYKVIGMHLPEFSQPENVFAPVLVSVKIAGGIQDSDGSVRLSVAPTDPNWYESLAEGVKEMISAKSPVKLVDYLGKSINGLDAVGLANCGELDVLDAKTGKLLRLKAGAELPAPPQRMATDKPITLRKWFNENKSKMVGLVAKELKGLSMSEIAHNAQERGVIQDSLERLIESTVPSWPKFVATYGMDHLARSSDPSEACSAVAGRIMYAVREGLEANEAQIRKYHSTVGTESTLWKKNKNIASQYQDDFLMYQHIAEDAIERPIVAAQIIGAMLHGHERFSRRPRRKRTVRKTNVQSEFHPIATYYSDIHYKKHGKLPGHLIERYNKRETFPEKYPGDAKKVFDVFNALLGNPTMPKRLPPLIPIQGSLRPAKGAFGDSRALPELVPIGTSVSLRPGASGAGTRALPELVPIGTSTASRSRPTRMPDLIPIGLPDLEPISEHADALAGLPDLSDFY